MHPQKAFQDFLIFDGLYIITITSFLHLYVDQEEKWKM